MFGFLKKSAPSESATPQADAVAPDGAARPSWGERLKAGLSRTRQQLGGGLASLFDQGFDLFDAVEDDLTMHGLVLIHRYNKELETG